MFHRDSTPFALALLTLLANDSGEGIASIHENQSHLVLSHGIGKQMPSGTDPKTIFTDLRCRFLTKSKPAFKSQFVVEKN